MLAKIIAMSGDVSQTYDTSFRLNGLDLEAAEPPPPPDPPSPPVGVPPASDRCGLLLPLPLLLAFGEDVLDASSNVFAIHRSVLARTDQTLCSPLFPLPSIGGSRWMSYFSRVVVVVVVVVVVEVVDFDFENILDGEEGMTNAVTTDNAAGGGDVDDDSNPPIIGIAIISVLIAEILIVVFLVVSVIDVIIFGSVRSEKSEAILRRRSL